MQDLLGFIGAHSLEELRQIEDDNFRLGIVQRFEGKGTRYRRSRVLVADELSEM